MAEHMRPPQGVGMTFEKLEGSNGTSWTWTLKLHGKKVKNGWEPTEKQAKAACWAALKEVNEKSATNGRAREKWRRALQYTVETRVYLVGAVLESIFGGADLERVMREAEAGEKDWWRQDKSPLKKPLPSHHLTLPAWKAAQKVFDCLRELKMIEVDDKGNVVRTPGLRRWAENIYGEGTFGGKGK